MRFLFSKTTVDLGLKVLLENDPLEFDDFNKKFDDKSIGENRGTGRKTPEMRSLARELVKSGLAKEKNSIYEVTNQALIVPKIIKEKENPSKEILLKTIEFLRYLESNGLLIKYSIEAVGQGYTELKDFINFIKNKEPSFKGNDKAYLNATMNFLKYIGILNDTKELAFTNLGQNVYSYLKINDLPDKRRYWQIAPGENARLWSEMENEGYIAVGWGKTPDLSNVKSKDELFEILKNYNFGDTPQNTQTSKLWHFLKEVKIGDKLVINKGRGKIIGIGEVIGDYYFESNASEYKHRKKVEYMWAGEVDIPSQGKFGTTLVELSKEEFDHLTSLVFDTYFSVLVIGLKTV